MAMKFAYNQILENVQLNSMVLAAAGDGVISGLDVSERGAGVNMSVDVAAGSALIGGTTYTESSIVNLAISTADVTHARKDLIIYDSATSNPLVIPGTPATPSLPPDITAGDILLAIVDIAAAVTTITNSEITDCIVEVVTGGSLDGLSNVVISSITNNELLAWDTSSSKWINQTPTEAAIAALAGFTMAGDINMADHNFTGINEFDSSDANGVDFNNSAGTRRIRLALTSWSFAADAPADMGSNKIQSVADPTLAQDAATKAWCEANFGAGTGDMLKSTYDPNTDGVIAVAQGGTGVTGDTYDADKVDGYHAGNSNGQVAVSNGTVCTYLNADKVDGCDAGAIDGNVFKILNSYGDWSVFTKSPAGLGEVTSGTDGYQLTTHSSSSIPTWAAASDLIFSDTHCPKCGQEFQDGDNLILHVIGHNEIGDILTIPMHQSCANQPKKTVTILRKVFEGQHILDEATGELVVQRVQKTQEKTVTKYKLKEGHVLDNKSGKAHKLDKDGKPGETAYNLSTVLETAEETISEVIYEDVEYTL